MTVTGSVFFDFSSEKANCKKWCGNQIYSLHLSLNQKRNYCFKTQHADTVWWTYEDAGHTKD